MYIHAAELHGQLYIYITGIGASCQSQNNLRICRWQCLLKSLHFIITKAIIIHM